MKEMCNYDAGNDVFVGMVFMNWCMEMEKAVIAQGVRL
jgi:hypothetical protein